MCVYVCVCVRVCVCVSMCLSDPQVKGGKAHDFQEYSMLSGFPSFLITVITESNVTKGWLWWIHDVNQKQTVGERVIFFEFSPISESLYKLSTSPLVLKAEEKTSAFYTLVDE